MKSCQALSNLTKYTFKTLIFFRVYHFALRGVQFDMAQTQPTLKQCLPKSCLQPLKKLRLSEGHMEIKKLAKSLLTWQVFILICI